MGLQWVRHFQGLLNQPFKVLLGVFLLTMVFMVINGSLWQYWSLQQSSKTLQVRMMTIEEKSKRLDFAIHEAKKTTFIERQATDQFDFVREGDLIFIFSE